jgi:uncharacterized protein YhaN
MWIEEVSIERFGLCKGMLIANLASGLTLLSGANEAGKTSVLEFIRSVFFGFRSKNPRVNNYEPPDGAPRSGWLTVRISNGERLRIQRTERPGMKEGMLTVWDESGKRLESSVVPLFRPGMDRNLFENLFAFDLDQMRHLDKQTLRGRIVAAALGSLDVNPLDVAKKLDERLKVLGKRSKRDPEALCAIEARIDDLNKRLKALAQKPDLYTRLRAELDAVATRRAEIAVEIAEADHSFQRLTLLVRYEKEWKRMLVLERELAELADAASFPPDGVNRLDRILDRKREAEEGLAEREKDLEHIQEMLRSTTPDRLLLAQGDRVHALARQARALADRPAHLERLGAEVAQANATLDQELSELGKGWDRKKLEESDPSLILEQRIRSSADSWQACRERIRDLETRLTESTEALERLEQKRTLKIEELRSNAPNCRGFLDPKARNKLLEWKELRKSIDDFQLRLVDQKRRIDTLAAERQYLAGNMKDLEQDDSATLPWGLFGTIAITLGISGIGVMWNAYHAADTRAFAFFLGGALMLILSLAVVAWKIRWDRGHRERVGRECDALRKRLDEKIQETIETEKIRRELMQSIHHLKRHAQERAAAVLGNPSAGSEDVANAERRSAAAEEFVRRARHLEENLTELQTEVELEQQRTTQIRKSLDVIRAEMAGMEHRWRNALRDEGFDPLLEPAGALDLVRALRELKRKERALVGQQERLASMASEWDAFTLAVSLLGTDLGGSTSGGAPLDLVEQWSSAERESRESLAQQRGLEERMRDHQIMSGVLRKKIQDAADEMRALMEAAAVDDEESFRRQARRGQRHESLHDERRVLLDNVLIGLQCPDEEALRTLMLAQDWDAHKVSVGTIQRRLQRWRAEAEELAAQDGRLRKEIETMEAEEETEKLLAEREEWLARLKSAVEEWLRYRLARGLLEKTLEMYETEKQPKVLEKGSVFFRSIAGEAFSRILLPMDRDHVLVERGNRSRVPEEHLSRGTLEQVYLALRLAHVHVYHQGEMAFPLMMDDVLVNFDPVRARSAAATLTEFSRETGVQILFFTCHPGTVGLFPRDVATVDMGPLGSGEVHER